MKEKAVKLTLKQKLEKMRKIIGPGLVTGASDDDPSGIATYSQAGAQFGLQTLRTATITLPLMAAIQEMCGRIGLVTKMGIIGVLKKNYSKVFIRITAIVTIPACILNIGADLSGMGAVAQMIIPGVNSLIRIFVFSILMIVSVVFFPYKKFESVMKRLAIVLVVYFVIPFLMHQNWVEILHATFVPHISFNKDFIAIIVAILGTTISPYLFVWEASMEVEEQEELVRENHKDHVHFPPMKRRVRLMQQGNAAGMIFSNLATFFIILTAGTILFSHGVHNIGTVQDAADALRPLAGDWSYALFALGVIGTGFLTVPVLAGACSYIISETFNRKGSINSKRKSGKSFYLVIIISVLMGAMLNLLGIDPIKSLIRTAVLYGLVAPVLIAIILHICNSKKIMGKYVNGTLSNILGVICFLLMAVAAVAMIVTSF